MPAAKKAAPRKKSHAFSGEFIAHLERIKLAKSEADSAARSVAVDAPRACVAIVWEMVFDRLCSSSDLSLSDFNTFAGVIQKLAAARVSPLENGAKTSASATALSEETIRKIEEQLKLL